MTRLKYLTFVIKISYLCYIDVLFLLRITATRWQNVYFPMTKDFKDRQFQVYDPELVKFKVAMKG